MGWDKSLPGIFALNVVMIVLILVTTALRFWSRAVMFKGRYRLDDWLCLAALFPTIVLGCLGTWMVRNGLGEPDAENEMMHDKTQVFKGFFVCAIMFNLGLGLTKLSTLAFYRRVFGGLRQRDRLSWTVPFSIAVLVTVGWPIMAIFTIVFRCHPVSSAWNLEPPHRCFTPISTYLLVLTVVNLVEDIILIVLPIPQILKLTLERRRKVLITMLMVFSASIPLICIGRLVTIAILREDLDNKFAIYIVPVAFWIIAEPAISLLAISLPALFPLVQRGRKYGLKSMLRRDNYPLDARKGFYSKSGTSQYAHRLDTGLELVRNDVGQVLSSVQVETGSSIKPSSSPNSDDVLLDLDGSMEAPEAIHVKREIRIRYEEPGSGPAI